MRRTLTATTTTGLLALSFMFAGCASTQTAQQTSAGTSGTQGVAPQLSENAAAILAYNAIREQPGQVRLGAGDRFGQHVHDQHMVLVQARHQSGEAIVSVPVASDD